MKKCKHCKAEIHKDAKKCQHCGSKQGMSCFKIGCIVIAIIMGIAFISSFKDSFKAGQQAARRQTAIGCNVPNPPIQYLILKDTTRNSDVKGIFIRECYINIQKQAPSIAELTEFAKVLGRQNENIEFFIFDDKKAYEINQRYKAILAAGGKDSDIPKRDWNIFDVHYIARYLKAYTVRRNNYLQPISDIYRDEGQSILYEIEIVN